jgi:tetratricopeptide (TPR) repeat protein
MKRLPPSPGDFQDQLDAEIADNRYQNALKLIEEAEPAVAGSTTIQILRGKLLRDLSKTRESITCLLNAHYKNPNNVQILNQLAISQQMAGDFKSSELSLDAVLALQPQHRTALLGKLKLSAQRDDYQQALSWAKRALDAYPKDTNISVQYGISLRMAGLIKESTRHFESLFAKHHTNTDVCLNLARNRVLQGHYNAAKSLIDKILRVDPDNHAAVLLRIDWATSSGLHLHALRFSHEALQNKKNDFSITVKLAKICITVGWAETALTLLDTLAAHSENVLFQLIRADSYARLGLSKQAGDIYLKVLKKHPKERRAILRSIDLALHQRDDKTVLYVLDHVQRTSSIAEKSADLQNLRLESLARAGDWVELLKICPRPSIPSEHDNIYEFYAALALFGSGELKAAQHNATRFLEHNPCDINGKILLADIELALGNREASLSIHRGIASTAGLTQHDSILQYATDLFRLSRFSEAQKCITTLRNRTGYFPKPVYIEELFKLNRVDEAESCIHSVNTLHHQVKLLASTKLPVNSELSTALSGDSFIDLDHLKNLFNFNIQPQFFGHHVNPATYLAWRLSKGRYGDFKNWSRRALHATYISRLLNSSPTRDEDIGQFIAAIDLTPIETQLQNGRGVILAVTHLGPNISTYLAHRLPTTALVFQNRHQATPSPAARVVGLAITGNQQEAAASAVTALRSGKILSTSPDIDIQLLLRREASPLAKITSNLFGVEITISNVTAKLSQELKVPSFWFQPEWREGKIHLTIEPLPCAEENESPDFWYVRWARAYLEKLETFMISAPENQNLDAPIWRFLLLNARNSAELAELLD